MTEHSLRARRILIGASCFADALSALRLVDAAEDLPPTDIRGLLFAEVPPEESAGSSGRRVVTPSGALVAAPSGRRAQALIAADAKAFQHQIACMAQSCAASWSFEMRAGELVEGVWGAEEAHDLLLVGCRPGHLRKGKVVLLTASGETSVEAKALAEALGRRLTAEVVLLALGPAEAPGGGHQGEDSPLRALHSRLNRINAEAVVMDLAAAGFRSPELLRAVLAAARCPLLALTPAEKAPPE